MMDDVLQRLRQRGEALIRLPVPPQPEDEMDMAERSSCSGDHLARMVVRMAAALRRVGLRPGAALVLAQPDHALEQVLLWLAAVLSGHDVHVLAHASQTLPAATGMVTCPPARKEHWKAVAQAHGVKLATLGGHWEGSLFMLQMVQQATMDARLSDHAPGCTYIGPVRRELDALLKEAAELAECWRLAEAPAVLASLPVLDGPDMLAAALAVLLHGHAPLYWLAPAHRARALSDLPALPDDTLLLADAAFLEQVAAGAGKQAAVLQRMRHVAVAPCQGASFR